MSECLNNEMVSRLRAEKTETMDEWFQKGKTAGLEDAESWHYQDLKRVAKTFEDGNLTASQLESDVWSPEFQAIYDDFLNESITELEQEDPAIEKASYIAGWIEGVGELWVKVEAEL